jgi:hypothetical protein
MVSSDDLLYDNVPASRVADLEHCHEDELTQEIDQCRMYRQSVGATCQHLSITLTMITYSGSRFFDQKNRVILWDSTKDSVTYSISIALILRQKKHSL